MSKVGSNQACQPGEIGRARVEYDEQARPAAGGQRARQQVAVAAARRQLGAAADDVGHGVTPMISKSISSTVLRSWCRTVLSSRAIKRRSL